MAADNPAPGVVSVVVPTWNGWRHLSACLAALARQTRPADEVIVVDNGSTDGSGDIAALAGAIVVHERRRGYGASYLRGFREARGVYFVMGDGDDSYTDQSLGGDIGVLTSLRADDNQLRLRFDPLGNPSRHLTVFIPERFTPLTSNECVTNCLAAGTGQPISNTVVTVRSGSVITQRTAPVFKT